MSDERRAVALEYDGEADAAPRVLARGAGALADRIVATAREHGVPIHADRDLVTLLAASELGDEIPVELYTAVAEVLAFLHRIHGRA